MNLQSDFLGNGMLASTQFESFSTMFSLQFYFLSFLQGKFEFLQREGEKERKSHYEKERMRELGRKKE